MNVVCALGYGPGVAGVGVPCRLRLASSSGLSAEVVAAEIPPTGSYPLSGIPEYLAVAIKPHVDAIMAPAPPDATKHATHSPELLSLAIADVNYCLNCVLHPDTCS